MYGHFVKIIVDFQLTLSMLFISSLPQNQLMKTIRFFRSSLTAIFKLCALKRTHLISSLCYPEQYGFTPPRKNKEWWFSWSESVIVGCCHELYYTLLFDKQFVPYCTTEYIFWLGKNKFDRGGPSGLDKN